MSGYFLLGVVELGDVDGKGTPSHKMHVWSRKPFVSDLKWLYAYLSEQTPEECRMRFITKPIRTKPNKKAKGSKKKK